MLASLLVLGLLRHACAISYLKPSKAGPGWSRFDLVISIGQAAPDCFQRNVVLVNGMKSPVLEVEASSMLYVNVFNKIPQDYPAVYEGISIHWHGFAMHNEASWFDGVAYVDQCPITSNTNFTYAFKVDEPPGTYFWHDHSFAWKGDGLQGALIVRPPAGTKEPFEYDAEHLMSINDWWHTDSNVMAMRLNRPFDADKVTNDTGAWAWVGNPQSILVNGNGYYNDCQLFPIAGSGTTPATCNATVFTVPPGRSAVQPWASDTNPGCTHESFTVEPGLTYRFRIIGETQLLYTTVCFEGHNVTVVAADSVPLDPFNTSCIDINAGQRFDVLLHANQPSGNYWISIQQQYRLGAPSGYAVLNYAGASTSTFPTTPTPQPTVAPWSNAIVNQMRMRPELLVPASANSSWAQYQRPQHGLRSLSPPAGNATRTIIVNLSQPIYNKTGILRWALDNVMSPSTPGCQAFRVSIKDDPKWLLKQAAGPVYGTGQGSLNLTGGMGTSNRVFELGKGPVPLLPSIGLQVVSIKEGDIIDVILQNNAANSFNGDYRPSGATRTAQEQHPFHLHGYHFWVLGTGLGVYDPGNATLVAELNTVDPIMRDTATVPQGGWTVVRFKANNPGIWPMHCHIIWHHYMGQQLFFVESPSSWTRQPKNFPKCAKKCMYNTNPFTKSWVQSRYGYAGYPLP